MVHRQVVVVFMSLFVPIVTFSGPAPAVGTTAGVGTTGASFLKLSVGARPEGLGDVGVVGLEGVESLYWNPACLASTNGARSLMVTHQQLWQDVSATGFAIGFPAGRLGTVAVGVERLGVEAWNNLGGLEAVEARDLAVLLGVGRRLTDRTDLGATARTLHSKIGDHSASGVSFDCGVRLRVSSRLAVAGAVRNLGPGLSYSDAGGDPLPVVGSLGGAWEWEGLTLVAEARKERGIDAIGCVGAEVQVHPMLALRGGARLGAGDERAGSDVTWGAGIGRRNGLRFDYSYRDSDLGASHQFSGMLPLGGVGLPGGGVSAAEAAGIPSNLVVVKELVSSGLDSLLAIMPVPGTEGIVIRRGGEPPARLEGDADDGSGANLVEDLLAERLTRRGLTVHVGSSPSGADTLAEASTARALPVLEYRMIELRVDYPSGRRRHYLGRKEVERVVRVHVHLRLLERTGGAVRWAGTAERARRDVVPFSLLRSLESAGFGFTRAEAEEQKWDKVLEPVIATAIVGGLIYLFYSNKGTD